jgi:hypothetical protein
MRLRVELDQPADPSPATVTSCCSDEVTPVQAVEELPPVALYAPAHKFGPLRPAPTYPTYRGGAILWDPALLPVSPPAPAAPQRPAPSRLEQAARDVESLKRRISFRKSGIIAAEARRGTEGVPDRFVDGQVCSFEGMLKALRSELSAAQRVLSAERRKQETPDVCRGSRVREPVAARHDRRDRQLGCTRPATRASASSSSSSRGDPHLAGDDDPPEHRPSHRRRLSLLHKTTRTPIARARRRSAVPTVPTNRAGWSGPERRG